MTKPLSQNTHKLFRILIAAVPLVTILYLFRPEALAIQKFIVGKSGICTLPASYFAARSTAKQMARADTLSARSARLQRTLEGIDEWQTPDGKWWVPSGSRTAFLYDLAEQDRDIYRTADGIMPGDVVLDCGANIGVFVAKALSRGAARVIAIEPAPENLAALRKNFEAEIASGRVVVYPKGVWDKDDILTMNVNPTNSAADSFVREQTGASQIELPLTTIDHIVSELHLDRVDFIKMDIEGAERKAIRGAAATIRRFRPQMALCVYHLSDDPTVVPEEVRSIDPGYRMECSCMQAQENVFPEVAHFRRK